MTSFRSRLLRIWLVVALTAAPLAVSAQLTPDKTGLTEAAKGTGLTSACGGLEARVCIATVIGRVIGVALGFVEVVLFFLFLYAGFLWMTAGGDEEKVKKARRMIYNAVAGLVIIALSYIITSFVLTQLTTALTGPVAPQ